MDFKSLSLLRRLQGWTPSQLAAQLQLTEADIDALERGEGRAESLEALSNLYNLELDALYEGRLEPALDDQATIFLFHGDYQTFDAGDLTILEPALQAARQLALASPEAMRRRLGFSPVRVDSSSPSAAAQQGYALARAVRAGLGLREACLPDMSVLLEQLGIHLAVGALQSPELRAAAILDADRSSAAVVLSSVDERRRDNPLLARVYLAHELCHLLFDASHPGQIQIALDDDQTRNHVAFLEKRARGFTAELLLPRAGLRELLGEPPRHGLEDEEARRFVREAREHFGTPWEIAATHLLNLKYFGKECWYRLSRSPSPYEGALEHQTTLPEEGAPSPPERVISAQARQARETVARLEAERAAAIGAVLGEAVGLAEAGQPRVAKQRLAEWVEEALYEARFSDVSCLMEQLQPDVLPPSALTGILMMSWPARGELGASRERFLARVITSLREDHGWEEERVQRTLERFK